MGSASKRHITQDFTPNRLCSYVTEKGVPQSIHYRNNYDVHFIQYLN